MDPSVCTSHSHDREDITIEQTDFFAATERELENKHSQLHGQDEPKHQRSQGHLNTQSPAHHEGITQRVADGHEPVIGHDSQQNAVRAAQEDEEEHLSATASQGDESSFCGQDTGQSERGDGGRVANLQGCQVAQEKVHGGVERAVDADDESNGEVATDADQVHDQEGHKYQHLHLREFGEGAEVEEDHSCLVCFLHVFND